VAVGAVFWAPRLFAPTDGAPSRAKATDPADGTSATNTVDSTRSEMARGGSAYPPAALPLAPVTAGDRFKLVGVVAPRDSVPGSQWVALIAVDDESARPFIAGATVKGDFILREVSARGVIIGPREGSVAIALDVLPAPAAGMAQAPTSGSGLESQDAPPGRGSKYLPLPTQVVPEPPIPAEGTSVPDDGRWRPPTGQ
jgi:general secretion pathway protein C